MSLQLKSVSKQFGGLNAVNNLSLSVPRGRITGLIGPNGAGKTTVVNLVTGIFKLSEGRILVDDNDMTQANADQVARAGVSRTFQNIRLLAEATVLENVAVGFHKSEDTGLLSQLIGAPSSFAESRLVFERSRELLERFDMARFADHPAGSLAYGHQRRVEMMRAIAAGPTTLLLDEPVAGMNDVEASELGEIFKTLASGGIAVLLIEHNVRFVSELCEYIYVMDTGRLIAEGSPQTVLQDDAVIAAYIGGAA